MVSALSVEIVRWTAKDPMGLYGSINSYAYVMNNPLNLKDPFGLAGEYDEFSQNAVDIGILDAVSVGMDAVIASKSARQMGYPGEHNGPQDAMRHCLWSCLMTNDIGEQQATEAAENHENIGDSNGQPCEERKMDEHNNEAGRKLGKAGGPRSCQQKCMDAIDAGALNTLE